MVSDFSGFVALLEKFRRGSRRDRVSGTSQNRDSGAEMETRARIRNRVGIETRAEGRNPAGIETRAAFGARAGIETPPEC